MTWGRSRQDAAPDAEKPLERRDVPQVRVPSSPPAGEAVSKHREAPPSHLDLPTAQPDLAPKGAPVAAANDAPRFQRFVGASERPPRLPQAWRRRRRLAAAFYCSCSFRLKAFWLPDVSAVFAHAASLMTQLSVSVHHGLLSC